MQQSTRSQLLSLVLSIIFISVPVIAFAAHPANIGEPYVGHNTDIDKTNLNDQIQSLLAQINLLQEKIRVLTVSPSQTIPSGWTVNDYERANLAEREKHRDYTSSGTLCSTFSRNLSIGSRGDDVLQLQQILAGNGFIQSSSATGYFGQQTKVALGLWQIASGITPASTFGPKSRAFLKRNCGIGVLPPYYDIHPPIPPVNNPPAYGCTEDAHQCSDGTVIGRSGPKCEFVCPTVTPSTKCTPRPVCLDTAPYCEIDIPNVCPIVCPSTGENAPVCGAPPFPSCPNGLDCIMVMPQPETYGNLCTMRLSRATFIHSGVCRVN